MLHGKRRRDLLEAALLFLIALFLNVGGQSVRTRDALSGKLIRLHTLANSDTEADQALKLEVRDRILQETASLTESARSRDEAIALLRERLRIIAAQDVGGVPRRRGIAEQSAHRRTRTAHNRIRRA